MRPSVAAMVIASSLLLPTASALARYYEPEEAVWLQPDRAGFVNGPNLYQYVMDRPTIAVDPTGTTFNFVAANVPASVESFDPVLYDLLGSAISSNIGWNLYIYLAGPGVTVNLVHSTAISDFNPSTDYGEIIPAACPLVGYSIAVDVPGALANGRTPEAILIHELRHAVDATLAGFAFTKTTDGESRGYAAQVIGEEWFTGNLDDVGFDLSYIRRAVPTDLANPTAQLLQGPREDISQP